MHSAAQDAAPKGGVLARLLAAVLSVCLDDAAPRMRRKALPLTAHPTRILYHSRAGHIPLEHIPYT